MTIRQHGGVFGRNPEFNDVEANSLDLATSLEVGTFQDANTFITRDAVGTVHGATSIVPSTTEKGIFDIAADNGKIAQNRGASLTFSNNIGLFQSGYTRVGGAITVEYSTALNLQRTHDMYLWASTASTLTKQLKINNNGNIEALRGNFVVPSGNGIDFSATAGTGTSELFDDYEEGTWTPTYTTDGTDFDSVNYDSRTHGRYVKIGSLVYVSCLVQTDGITVGSASGDVLIGGLPFTASNDPSNAEGNTGAISSFAFAGDHPSVGFAMRNSTTIKLQYRATANGAVSDLQIADLNTGANDNFLQLALSYRA